MVINIFKLRLFFVFGQFWGINFKEKLYYFIPRIINKMSIRLYHNQYKIFQWFSIKISHAKSEKNMFFIKSYTSYLQQ